MRGLVMKVLVQKTIRNTVLETNTAFKMVDFFLIFKFSFFNPGLTAAICATEEGEKMD